MKLIIDIPDNIYDAIKKAQTIISGQRSGKTLLQILVNSVENGTPLDDVKAEIMSYRDSVDRAISEDEFKRDGMKIAYQDCIEIIDKHMSKRNKNE